MRAHLLHIALAKCQQALAFGCARGVRWHSAVSAAKRLTDQISYRGISMSADLPVPKKQSSGRRLYWAILTKADISSSSNSCVCVCLFFLLCSPSPKTNREIRAGSIDRQSALSIR